jgi:hypothetical protein
VLNAGIPQLHPDPRLISIVALLPQAVMVILVALVFQNRRDSSGTQAVLSDTSLLAIPDESPPVCRRETNMNSGQFVDRTRAEAPQQMIDSLSMGLKEIADACGFEFADSTGRTFLRVIGHGERIFARFKRAGR